MNRPGNQRSAGQRLDRGPEARGVATIEGGLPAVVGSGRCLVDPRDDAGTVGVQRLCVQTDAQNHAERVFVHVGQRSAAHAEVRSGLAEGTPVILHPTDVIVDGVPVRAAQPEAR